MLKSYEELTEAKKEVARDMIPNEYTEYVYKTAGVEIEFAAK